ncbi:hypothetical protein [Pseudonocardia sp. GCM10023141]|uniref:hypothetical protein n=1 Tax=Pseudonocardia sp. GCM10023141 TaxID=3252653 RepID=UPI00361E713F
MDFIVTCVSPAADSQSRRSSRSGVVAPNDRTLWARLPFPPSTPHAQHQQRWTDIDAGALIDQTWVIALPRDDDDDDSIIGVELRPRWGQTDSGPGSTD